MLAPTPSSQPMCKRRIRRSPAGHRPKPARRPWCPARVSRWARRRAKWAGLATPPEAVFVEERAELRIVAIDPNESASFAWTFLAHQQQREQCREAERGGHDQDLVAHDIDQDAEGKRSGRLCHPRRRTNNAEPVGVILRAEDRQRQRPARDREDAVAGAVED